MTSTALLTPEPPPPRWFSTVDASDLLGVAPRTLYKLIDDGELRAFRSIGW